MALQESRTKSKVSNNGHKSGKKTKKIFILCLFIIVFIIFIVTSVIIYKHILSSLRRKKLLEDVEELEKKIQSLNSDNLSIIVDDFENVEHFEVSRLDAQENNPDKLLKFQVYQTDVLIETFIILEEIEEFIIINNESISDCDDDEYVTANIIEENIEEYYHWALCVEQLEALTDNYHPFDLEENFEVFAKSTTHYVYIEPLNIYEVLKLTDAQVLLFKCSGSFVR